MSPVGPTRRGNVLASGTLRALCFAAAIVLIAGLYVVGAQPVAVGLVPPPWDKLAHVALFGLLGVLLMIASGGRRAWLVVAVLVVVAIADELLQTQLPGRHASVADLAADFVGAVAGVAVVVLAVFRSPSP